MDHNEENKKKVSKENSESSTENNIEKSNLTGEISNEGEVLRADTPDTSDEPDESIQPSTNDSEEASKVTIEFPYSELIREKVPKAFEVAEKVAADWKNEGDFSDLGIPHPLASIVASQALQKAKDVEKKLEEKGVFTMAKMGFEIAKAQVENIKNKVGKG